MPDLHREEHRINNRRERCSFPRRRTIAKMMSSTNKSDLGWLPFLARSTWRAPMALVDVGLQQQLSEIDQAIGRFPIRSVRCRICRRPSPVLMKAFLGQGHHHPPDDAVHEMCRRSRLAAAEAPEHRRHDLRRSGRAAAAASEGTQSQPRCPGEPSRRDADLSAMDDRRASPDQIRHDHRCHGQRGRARRAQEGLGQIRSGGGQGSRVGDRPVGLGQHPAREAGSSTTRSSDTGAPSTSIRRTQTRHSTSSSPTSTASNAMPGRPTPATCWWRWAHSRTIWLGGPTAARTARCFPGCSSCLPMSVTARPSRNV